MAIVVDNTVLSNFALVSRLDLLRDVCGQVHVTHEVQEEAMRGLEEGYAFLKQAVEEIRAAEDAWLRLIGYSADEELRFRLHSSSFGYGEASCLAIAECRGWLVLTDDRAARQTLKRNGCRFSGTLGVLKQAMAKGIISIDEGNRLLHRMIQAGYRSPTRDLADI